MKDRSAATEAVVRNHLKTFLEERGVAAIVEDYGDRSRIYTEAAVYTGRLEIALFFEQFLASLPDGAIGRFSLRSLRVDDDLAYLTWSSGKEIPLGTDTFVVADGKIASQTVAIYAAPGA
jgi:hypothetical protein